MKSLRVITTSLNIGGTERHLSQILPKLIQRGWQVRVIALKGEGFFADILKQSGCEVFFPKMGIRNGVAGMMSAFLFLYQEFRKDKKTMTHFYLPQAYILGALAALCAGFVGPQIMSRRSLNNYQERYCGVRWLEGLLHKRMSVILGNSRAVVAQLRKEVAIESDKVALIYNGVELPFLEPRDATQPFTMIMVANLLPYKGYEDLLGALKITKDKLPVGWQMLCVGKGTASYTAKLKHLTRTYALDKHLHWLGGSTSIVPLLMKSDVGILCSHEEGFSNVVLEYMAAKLPCIVSDVGGNAEAVLHEHTGLVVPPRNPAVLAEAILHLCQNSDVAHMYAKEARTRVEAEFSLELCLKHYEDIYERCHARFREKLCVA